MRMFALILTLSAAILTGSGVADAQSLIGVNKDCGTYRWDGDLVKGRTDSMVVRVDHAEGCYRYVAYTHIGADREEMASDPGRERAWQQSACMDAGRQMIHGHFKWYRGMDIDAKNVDGSIKCELWNGDD